MVPWVVKRQRCSIRNTNCLEISTLGCVTHHSTMSSVPLLDKWREKERAMKHKKTNTGDAVTRKELFAEYQRGLHDMYYIQGRINSHQYLMLREPFQERMLKWEASEGGKAGWMGGQQVDTEALGFLCSLKREHAKSTR